MAAKAIHAMLCHEESRPRRAAVVQRMQQPKQLLEGAVLPQAVIVAGQKNPQNLEMVGLLRDIALSYVEACREGDLPSMAPSALFVYMKLREAVRGAGAAECIALFDDIEVRNHELAQQVKWFAASFLWQQPATRHKVV